MNNLEGLWTCLNIKNTVIDMSGDAAGKLVPKKTATVAKETTGSKAVKAAREQANAKGEKLTKTDADKVRKSVSTKNNTARGVNSTVSEFSGNATGNTAAEVAKRKLEDENNKR